MTFTDRTEAGEKLAAELSRRGWSDPVVLALPRGGLPVAAIVAATLDAPLDVVVARKIGAPDQPELAVGAVTADGVYLLDDATLSALGLRRPDVADQLTAATAEARRRQNRFGAADSPPLSDRDVIIVDDGLATGMTALAAVHTVREHNPRSICLAVPVGSSAAVRRLEAAADTVVCLSQPRRFTAVGQWYRDFRQISDAEVDSLMAR
ncbi:phosphoribosyltransferase [Haloechinothrix halophila]|uniref:phosphoribosyltransferase n=1 Tax=Haloechinothrix halophila TaxID=1069073 RepID=UPI0004127330|nr:phosphoribosyltransferase family protein [Haloechinothrix halophila]